MLSQVIAAAMIFAVTLGARRRRAGPLETVSSEEIKGAGSSIGLRRNNREVRARGTRLEEGAHACDAINPNSFTE